MNLFLAIIGYILAVLYILLAKQSKCLFRALYAMCAVLWIFLCNYQHRIIYIKIISRTQGRTAETRNRVAYASRIQTIRTGEYDFMKRKRQVLKFLEDNYCMINSLMSKEERLTFQGDVVSAIESEIKKQIKEEENEDKAKVD